MSAPVTESLKAPSANADSNQPDNEPSAKKAKLDDPQQANLINNNDQTNANEKVAHTDDLVELTKTTSSASKPKEVPSKTFNGNTATPTATNELSDKNVSSEDVDDEGSKCGFDQKFAESFEQVELIQQEICNLNEKASEEILKVEQKFNKLRRPHFEKRNELLKTVPNFWVTTLINHPLIAPLIEHDEDENCLRHLVELDVEEFEDIKSGYKFSLHFSENPYFANEVIVKEFQLVSSDEVTSTTSPIEFLDTPQGRALKTIVTQFSKLKNSRRAGGKYQSFFAWLVDPCESGDEIAEILKDQIWPNPLDFYFTNPEDYGADEESEDEEYQENEDESDDDEEQIEEDLVAGGVLMEDVDEEYPSSDDDDDEDDDLDDGLDDEDEG